MGGAPSHCLRTPLAHEHVRAGSSNLLGTERLRLFHNYSLVARDKSGFRKAAITGGLTTLQRLENGEYDILFVDVRKQIISYQQDGALVKLLRRGANDATFLVVFPGMTIELYTFYMDADGARRFDILQSKGGDQMPIHESTVMTGTCSQINLNLIK
jgi:hypothetical protein